MAIQYSAAQRQANMTALIAQMGAAAHLAIYTGAQPVTCATVSSGTLLASLACTVTTPATASGGVLTMAAITAAATGAAGTAGYWRLFPTATLTGVDCVAQGTVGVSGADLNFAGGVVWTLGETISITSFTITANGA